MIEQTPRQIVWVSTPTQRYPVYLGENIFAERALLAAHIHGQQVMIVTQEKIAALYLPSLLPALQAYQCDVWYLPDGEPHKNIIQWQNLLDQLIGRHERSTTLIALGGGVVGDLTGFAAACFQRGVNYLQIPTTLIAQVDAALGGKTAINHPRGKNLLGAFYQPQAVITDIALLSSLPEREYLAGLAEVIKYGLIYDAEFFCWLEKNMVALRARDKQALLYAVMQSVSTKAHIVGIDEHDHGLRQILNFGHTFGHALETQGHYQTLLHGEAVAIGMAMATQLSLLAAAEQARILALLCAAGFKLTVPISESENFVSLMRRDKKVRAGKINLVLLQKIGQAYCAAIEDQQIISMLNIYCRKSETPIS